MYYLIKRPLKSTNRIVLFDCDKMYIEQLEYLRNVDNQNIKLQSTINYTLIPNTLDIINHPPLF